MDIKREEKDLPTELPSAGLEQQGSETDNDEGYFEVTKEEQFKRGFQNLGFRDLKIQYKTPSGEEKSYDCHRIICAGRSSFSEMLFKDDDEKSARSNLFIAGLEIEEHDMKTVMDIIYTGKSGPIENARKENVLKLLRYFQVKNDFSIENATEGKPSCSPMKPPTVPKATSSKKRKNQSAPEGLPKAKVPRVTGKKIKTEKNIKTEKIQVEKVSNGVALSDEEMAIAMSYNLIPIEDGSSNLCIICGNQFSFLNSAKRHFKNIHGFEGGDKTHCQGCGNGMSTSEMIDHFLQQPCGKAFNEALDQDYKSGAGEADQYIVKTESGGARCLSCNQEFSYLHSAKRHYKNIHSFKTEIKCHCIICGHTYQDITGHYKTAHNVPHREIINRFKKFEN